jgi:RNA polymerase sigma-70 factor (ECF subfamily)
LRNKLEVGIPNLLHDILPDKSSISHFRLEIEQELFEAYKTFRSKLSPAERGVFMLRELFHLEYEEISVALEKHADNCRQLLSRARKALKNTEMPKSKSLDWTEIQAGFHSFIEASQSGKLEGLISYLKKEMEWQQ